MFGLLSNYRIRTSLIVGIALIICGLLVAIIYAAAPVYFGFEAEQTSPAPGVTIQTDSQASNGQSVQFGSAPSSYFSLIPVGSSLPTEADCATRVRTAPEVRNANATYNATRGTNPHNGNPRVTGNYTGTTDQIIQWAACKWGVDEDVARAIAAKESYWFQRNQGDWTTNAANCAPSHPIGADGRPGECPESFGIVQVRYPYHTQAFEDRNAELSTAYNLDYVLSIWRDCFEGDLTWLNTVERGATYASGDMWGCFGVWFSGRWYTQPAVDYINAVKDWHQQRIWETASFKNYQG